MRTAARLVAPVVALALLAALPGERRALAGVQPVAGKEGMVATTNPIASQIAAGVLRKGGNAVDAAVAAAAALAVLWPRAGNLGGGGFMLIRMADGKSEVIDYRETAPRAATRGMYLDDKGRPIPDSSTVGYRAVAVPGTVAGLALALERHGTRPFAELLEPARVLAAEGYLVDQQAALSLEQGGDHLASFEDSRRIFLHDGRLYAVGERLVQADLARTLARLQERGPREFYEGETARLIAADMKAHGGLLTAEDLRAYRPVVRAPLEGSYRGHAILTVPPPSAGGVALIESLNLLERFQVGALGFHSADEIHLLVEVLRRAFTDRGARLGDPAFVRAPLAGLLAKSFAATRAADIDLRHATAKPAALDPARFAPALPAAPAAPAGGDRPETTHFTIVDGRGNVVTNTYTLDGPFGSSVVAHGTGVLLNDEMDDFCVAPGVPNYFGLVQGEANAIAPGKRPLSSMTPTIVLKDGRPLVALGSPGGPTIISTVLQVIVNLVDHGMNLAEAVAAPRFHHQAIPDQIDWEPWGLPRETRVELEARGHRFSEKPKYLGDVQGVMLDPKSGMRYGASDPRLDGAAVGY